MKQGINYDHGLDNIFSHEAVELQEHLPRETERSVVTCAMWLRRVTADPASPWGSPVCSGHRSVAKVFSKASVVFSHV